MNWSWTDYQETPVAVIEQVVAIMEEEAARADAQREQGRQ